MTGISVHIGVNRVNEKSYYPLIVPDLVACENDAIDMQTIAGKIGYKASTILSEDATYESVKNAIADAMGIHSTTLRYHRSAL